MNDPSLLLRSLPDRLPISLGDLREFAGVAHNFGSLCLVRIENEGCPALFHLSPNLTKVVSVVTLVQNSA